MIFRPRGARHEVVRDLDGIFAVDVRPIMGVVPSIFVLLVLLIVSTMIKSVWLKYSVEGAITVAVSNVEWGPELLTTSTYIEQCSSEGTDLQGVSKDANDAMETNK
jgi:hypothetical protein